MYKQLDAAEETTFRDWLKKKAIKATCQMCSVGKFDVNQEVVNLYRTPLIPPLAVGPPPAAITAVSVSCDTCSQMVFFDTMPILGW